jgi:zinc protease
MEDLDAASLEDVRAFFQTYYGPGNASLAIAGDVQATEVIPLVEKYFGEITPTRVPSPITQRPVKLEQDRRVVLEDDVHLPRLYIAWHTPALFAPGDAEMDIVADVLGAGKAARLYSRLVHDLEIAQDVEAWQNSGQLGSSLMLTITAREGIDLERIELEARSIIGGLATDLTQRELERARNHVETSTVDSLQGVGGFDGKADRLNHYHFYTGLADSVAQDLARYALLTPEHVRAALQKTIASPAVVVTVVPEANA